MNALLALGSLCLIFGLGFFVYLMIFRSRRINNTRLQRLLWIAEKEARKQRTTQTTGVKCNEHTRLD